jgi:phosphate transport system protein
MAEADRSGSRPAKNKTWFREELNRLEQQVLGGLDMVVSQLDRALDAITFQDAEMAAMVAADDSQIDGRYVEVHQGVLSLLGRQPLFLDDLRLAAALLHSIRCIERMGDQCANIAKLAPLSDRNAPKDLEILELIETMGIAARHAVLQCRDAFRTRDTQTAGDLAAQDTEISRMNRSIFQRAVDIGEDTELREWAMFMVLVARCLERISGNTVDIAEQARFVQTGIYHELADTPDRPPTN